MTRADANGTPERTIPQPGDALGDAKEPGITQFFLKNVS